MDTIDEENELLLKELFKILEAVETQLSIDNNNNNNNFDNLPLADLLNHPRWYYYYC